MTTDLGELYDALSAIARGTVERSYPLARFTTYRLGGPAEIYIEPAGLDDLMALSTQLRELDPQGSIPVLVVGRGSNLVISDTGWPGIAMRLGQPFAALEPRDDDPASFDVGAGKPLPLVANWSARRELSGMEWGVGVPGSIGGAVRMNAGAHGTDLAATLVQATVLSLESGEVTERTREQLDLSYRHSNLTDREVVVSARLKLTPEPRDAIRARMETFRKHRAATQPGALQNAGSTFKNPEGDSAGQAGRGRRPQGVARGRRLGVGRPRQLLHGRRHRNRPGRIRPNPRCAAKGKRCFRSGTNTGGQVRGVVRKAGN